MKQSSSSSVQASVRNPEKSRARLRNQDVRKIVHETRLVFLARFRTLVQANKKKRRENRKRARLSCRQRKRRAKRAEKDHEEFMRDAKIFLKNWEPTKFETAHF